MPKEYYKPLNEGDLNQNVSEPHCDEVEQLQRLLWLRSRPHGQRNHQNCEHREQGNDQYCSEHGHSQINLPVDLLLKGVCVLKVGHFEGKEKERRVGGSR